MSLLHRTLCFFATCLIDLCVVCAIKKTVQQFHPARTKECQINTHPSHPSMLSPCAGWHCIHKSTPKMHQKCSSILTMAINLARKQVPKWRMIIFYALRRSSLLINGSQTIDTITRTSSVFSGFPAQGLNRSPIFPMEMIHFFHPK